MSKRVLEKNPDGARAVREVYDRTHNQLHTNVTLDSPTRGDEFTGEGRRISASRNPDGGLPRSAA